MFAKSVDPARKAHIAVLTRCARVVCTLENEHGWVQTVVNPHLARIEYILVRFLKKFDMRVSLNVCLHALPTVPDKRCSCMVLAHTRPAPPPLILVVRHSYVLWLVPHV